MHPSDRTKYPVLALAIAIDSLCLHEVDELDDKLRQRFPAFPLPDLLSPEPV